MVISVSLYHRYVDSISESTGGGGGGDERSHTSVNVVSATSQRHHTHTAGGGYPTLPPNRTDLLDVLVVAIMLYMHNLCVHVLCVLLILCFHL